MKKQLLSLLLLLSFVVSVSAQKAQVAKTNPLEANLRRHIEYLASDKLEGRRAGEPGATLAAKYIADQFAKLKLKPGITAKNGKRSYLQPFSFTPVRDPHGATPTDQSSTPAKSFDASNVIGILEGRDPVLKNEAIVIGAHYDHLGRGGAGSLAANSTEIHHGADDNASGVAAIIEIARQFARERNNKRTLIFIAFSGEEEGLFGSNFYVNNPIFPLDKTIAMINLDMVGRLKDNKLTIGGVGTASEWKSLVEFNNKYHENGLQAIDLPSPKIPMEAQARKVEVTRRLSINPFFTLQLNEDGFGPSDHSSFYSKKVPVLFFFSGTHIDYHKPSDTAEKINYAGEASLISYAVAITKAIDQNPMRPTYAIAKSSNTGGRTGFNISLGTIPNYGDSTDGMLIDGVRDDSPAAKAGVKTGDKVIKLAGRDIRNVYDYTDTLVDMKAGEEYEVVVLRGTVRLTLKILPVKR